MVRPPWADPGRGLFSISVAAELAGLHPHTLRLYEQEGLLAPARSPGGPAATAPVTSTACARSWP
jgi:MerR family transcriptional regulator/heat shock protein HspR